jgi:hypothetical protein
MNSFNPHSKDELDGLVREALRAWVGSQEPPRRVWTRIRQDLAPGQLPPRRFRARWPSLAAQFVLTLLLVMLGVAGLQTAQLSPTIVPVTDLPRYMTDMTADDQDPTVSRAIGVPVEPDVDALKAFTRPARQADGKLPSRLSETALLERRLLRGEPASPFPRPAQERMGVFSMPPEE